MLTNAPLTMVEFSADGILKVVLGVWIKLFLADART